MIHSGRLDWKNIAYTDTVANHESTRSRSWRCSTFS